MMQRDMFQRVGRWDSGTNEGQFIHPGCPEDEAKKGFDDSFDRKPFYLLVNS
jgi:hypothetical protein